MTLNIAPGLRLPVDAVTETFAILAKRGVGKSNAAVVMAEEMYDAGLPWVAIDPKGDWWGVRSSGDGKAPGLSVLVFGGEHGDVPLEPTGGELAADLIVDHRLTCVLDVSEMSKRAARDFLRDFATRLYKRNREPLHVFCEEADEYIPQRVFADETRLVHAFEILVKRGRFHGLGCTLITQRSASLNKDVLTQVETLVAMRTTGPPDRKAVKAWVDWHETGDEAVAALPELGNGEAFVFSPHFLKAVSKVQFRRRRTFDSGATPKVGRRATAPTKLADVDLAAIKEAMADTIERARENDPQAMRAEITRLRARISELERARAPERIEVPVLDPDHVRRIEAVYDKVALAHTELAEQLAAAVATSDEVIEQTNMLRAVLSTAQQPAPPRAAAPSARTAEPRPAARSAGVEPERAPSERARSAQTGGSALSKSERAILVALASHPSHARTRRQIALTTGYSGKSGGFRNSLSKLRTAGYITSGTDPVEITDEGLAAVGDFEPLPTGWALIEYWGAHPQVGRAARLILETLAGNYPATLTREEVAARTGYSVQSGGFRNALSKLRTLELITDAVDGQTKGLRASDELFEEN